MNSLADVVSGTVLGIAVDLAKLPGYEAEQEVLHKVFGRNEWTGFWRFTVLRNLFPNRHQRLVEEWRELYGRYRQEFLDELMTEGKARFSERQDEA